MTLAVLASMPPRAAVAAAATAWVKGAHSEARLIDGGAPRTGSARRFAGLEVRLDPAFVTYWRDPGDAGVPPTFDFGGSDNLKAAEVRYPAPAKLDEAGTTAFGYTGDVTFPIAVEPLDPARPVTLHVDLAYAVCHDICLPAHAVLTLALAGDLSAEASRIETALAAVPRAAALGQAVGPLAILGVEPAEKGDFTVEAEGPPGTTLFVEASGRSAYAAGAASVVAGGRLLFPVKRLDGPGDGSASPVTLTLVAPGDPPLAIETRVNLDDRAKTP